MYIPRDPPSTNPKWGLRTSQNTWTTPRNSAVKQKTPAPTQEQLQECKSLLEAVAPDRKKAAISLEQEDGHLIIDGVRIKIHGGDGTSSINLIR